MSANVTLVNKPTKKKKYKSPLVCACCGLPAGHWEQWPNQDTGYGICYDCVQWQKEEFDEREEVIKRSYGIENINWGWTTDSYPSKYPNPASKKDNKMTTLELSELKGLYPSIPKGPARSEMVKELKGTRARSQPGYSQKLVAASQLYRTIVIDIAKIEYKIAIGLTFQFMNKDESKTKAESLIKHWSYDLEIVKEVMDNSHAKLESFSLTDVAFEYYNDNESYIKHNIAKCKEGLDRARAEERAREEEEAEVNYYEEEEDPALTNQPFKDIKIVAKNTNPTPKPPPPQKETQPVINNDTDLETRILLKYLKKEVPEERVKELEALAKLAAEAVRE